MGETWFRWEVRDIGVKVAALMTEAIILRRLARPIARIASSCPAAAAPTSTRLSADFGVPFVRGPDEVQDLPRLSRAATATRRPVRHDIRIFAEIVDASALAVEALVARAAAMRAAGADVIDLGCLPDTPFPHLEDARPRAAGKPAVHVSVDSADLEELRAAPRPERIFCSA